MKDLFVNTQLPVVTSDRILYTPSKFCKEFFTVSAGDWFSAGT